MRARRPMASTTARVGCVFAASTLLLGTAISSQAQSLGGSRASLDRQVRAAARHDFTYLRTATQVRSFANAGYLVPLGGNRDYTLHQVSFPYARPEVKLFVERLSAQYRRACGEVLVVTSLTRPQSRQPRNASDRSVHPTGMALDLRRSNRRSCRNWIEDVLLSLEQSGVLEGTRERRPPHYHVAVFPREYRAYVARITGRTEAQVLAAMGGEPTTHRVRPRETLWNISRRYGTSPQAIQSANGLRSTTIYPGQVLKIPGPGR